MAETIIGHPQGQTKSLYEIIEYPARGKTSVASETHARLETASKAETAELKLGDENRNIERGKAAIPAKVARTLPEDGSENVPTSLKEIVIVFDQPMSGAWSINCSPGFYPDAPSGRRCSQAGNYWQNERTFVIQLTTGLRSSQRYSFAINPSVGLDKYDLAKAFRGLGQPKPALPQRFFFTTAP